MSCQTCGGNVLGDGKCLQCGRQAVKLLVYSVVSASRKKEHEGIKERVVYVKNKRGTCSNCLRDNLCLNSGICSTCLKATRGTHKGTAEYEARLKAVRERLRPGMFKAA